MDGGFRPLRRRKPLVLLGYGLSGLVRPLIGLAQTGALFSPDALRFNWERLAPSRGMRRTFSPAATGRAASRLSSTRGRSASRRAGSATSRIASKKSRRAFGSLFGPR